MSSEASIGGLKARDIESIMRSMGTEKGTVYCLTKLAEYQAVIRESQMELATQIVQIADIVSDFATVAGNMKNAVEELQKKDKEAGDAHTEH